jgi:hypothetical protein
MKARGEPEQELPTRSPMGRENEYACAWIQVVVLLDDICDFCVGNSTADSTRLEKRLEEWIGKWETAFRMQHNPFVESSDPVDADTTLCLLLPYLSCICLLFRKRRSCVLFIAASFMTGILGEMRERGIMHFLPTFATIYFLMAAENFSCCGDAEIAESVERNFTSLEMSLEQFEKHYSGAGDTLTVVQELRGKARSALQLNPITAGEKKYFVPLNPKWCNVPQSCIQQGCPV